MVTMNEVLNQFRRLGVKASYLARGEIKELPNILAPHEKLQHVVMGWYDGGLALLCATNHRVLLIDRKLFFLTVEDLRYDMIAEVKYQYRLLETSVSLTYSGRTLEFKSWNQSALRNFVSFIQDTITNIEAARNQVQGEEPSSKPLPLPEMPQPAVTPPTLAQIDTYPIENYQPAQQVKNPYQTGKQIFRRHKISRFVTESQLSR